jgi:hypothetical protein
MPSAVLRYRCRRCQLLSDGLVLSDTVVVKALRQIIHGLVPSGSPQSLYDLHDCADGGYGVSDLIGAELQDAQPESVELEIDLSSYSPPS